jgi:hypothetical protein
VLIKRLSCCYIKFTQVKLVYVKLCKVSDKKVNMNSVDGMRSG